ncbi:hypothetical protein D3C81_1720030 [compost metagenome]
MRDSKPLRSVLDFIFAYLSSLINLINSQAVSVFFAPSRTEKISLTTTSRVLSEAVGSTGPATMPTSKGLLSGKTRRASINSERIIGSLIVIPILPTRNN